MLVAAAFKQIETIRKRVYELNPADRRWSIAPLQWPRKAPTMNLDDKFHSLVDIAIARFDGKRLAF